MEREDVLVLRDDHQGRAESLCDVCGAARSWDPAGAPLHRHRLCASCFRAIFPDAPAAESHGGPRS